MRAAMPVFIRFLLFISRFEGVRYARNAWDRKSVKLFEIFEIFEKTIDIEMKTR